MLLVCYGNPESLRNQTLTDTILICGIYKCAFLVGTYVITYNITKQNSIRWIFMAYRTCREYAEINNYDAKFFQADILLGLSNFLKNCGTHKANRINIPVSAEYATISEDMENSGSE